MPKGVKRVPKSKKSKPRTESEGARKKRVAQLDVHKFKKGHKHSEEVKNKMSGLRGQNPKMKREGAGASRKIGSLSKKLKGTVKAGNIRKKK